MPPLPSIDLNCDLGEGTGADDLALLEIVSSANIACGGHAGDDHSMITTIEAADSRGVRFGAHPGYPDRANFGRVTLQMTPAEIEATVFQQVARLGWLSRVVGCGDGSAAGDGGGLSHVKLHGALYHRAMTDEPIALAVAAAVKRVDPHLYMVAMPGTAALRLWRAQGFTVLIEAFADRAYESDGSLRSRTKPGALITDPAAAAAQALAFALSATAQSGPHTICIHSDTPGAVAVAKAVREMLIQNGIAIKSPQSQIG